MIPLFNQVLIEIKKKELVTSSGIHLATAEDGKLEEATVIAVGDDCVKLKAKDRILFKSYSTDTIKLGGEDVSFIKEEDVLAIIDAQT